MDAAEGSGIARAGVSADAFRLALRHRGVGVRATDGADAPSISRSSAISSRRTSRYAAACISLILATCLREGSEEKTWTAS